MRVLLSVFLFFVGMVCSVSQPIQSYDWKSVVINGGGYVPGFVYSRATKNLLYARTDVGGAYRWDPLNRRWIPLSDFVTSGNQLGVISMAADPVDSNRVYMVTGLYTNSWDPNGVFFASSDRGNTWSRYELPCKVGGNEPGRGTGERLQVDPNLPNKLYFASQEQGLFQSLDYGMTWSKVTSFPRNNCTFLEIDPNSGTRGNASQDIYVGTYDHLASRDTTVGGLYRSVDGGNSWAYWAGQFPKVEPKDYDNPRRSTPAIPNNLVFAGNNIFITMGNDLAPGTSNGYVVRFNRLTNVWTKIYPFSRNTQGGYNSLTVHPTNPNIVMVGTLGYWWPTSDRIYITTNAGTTWTDVRSKMKVNTKNTPHGGGMGWNSGLKINPFNPSEAVFGSGNGLWMTNNLEKAFTNDSTLWVYENDNFEETVPLALASPPTGAELISGLGDIKGFVHLDVTRSPEDSYHHHGNTYSVDFAENDPRIIVRAHDGGIRASISRDNGLTWTDFATQAVGGDTRQNFVSISPNGNTIIWAPSDSFPSVSSNGGATWTLCSGLGENVFPKSDRVNSSIFYAIDNATGFFHRSTDGARTFVRTATTFPFTGGMNIVPVFGREGHVWLSAGANGLHFTTNGGASFTKINTVDEANRVTFGKAAPNATYPSIFIYGKIDGIIGLFRSDNIGSSWIKINNENQEFGRGFNRGISGDPKVYGRLYVATDGRGILYGDAQGTSVCYTPNLGEKRTICKSSVVLLNPNIPTPGYTYRWSKDGVLLNSTSSVLGISLPGNYLVSASIAGCPLKSDNIIVDSKLLPVNSPSICPGQSATMTVTVPSTYAWFSSANVPLDTANFLTVAPLTTTSYFVKDIATTLTTLGQPTYSSGGWGIGNAFNNGQNQVRLSVLDDITLKSISLYVLGAGTNGVIRILDSNGNVVTFARKNGLAVGLQPISFNDFKLTQGEYLIDAVSTTGYVQFQTDRTNAKFNIPNYATMTPVPGWAYGIFFNLTFEIGNTCAPTPARVVVSNPPLVTITSTGRTFCQSQGVTLSATTGSSYVWRNGTATVGSAAFFVATTSGAYTVEVANAIGCKGTSPVWTVTAIPSIVPTVTITSSATTVCSGTGVTFTATGFNGGSTPTYTWFRNTIQIGTGTTIALIPSNGDQISARLTAGGTLPTCLAPTTATSNLVNLTVNPIPSPNVTITSSATTVCSGTGVTFTATGFNGGSNPAYTWFRNNTQIGTGSTISVTPTNGDQISARLTAGGTLPACLAPATAISNLVNLTVNPIPSPNVNITSSLTIVCSGTGVTFTATGVNGGSTPTYTWFRNNTQFGTGTTITISPSNGDQISARLTAGGTLPACLSPTTNVSNVINLTVNSIPSPNVTIISSATTVCSGTGVTFTATGLNGGSTPTYTWFRNNTQIGTGTTNSVNPSNGDQISARLTAGGTLPTCLASTTATSNLVNLTVNPIPSPNVTITSSLTTVCSGTGVTFTATGLNGGSTPTFTWFRNAIQIGTGTTITVTPTNGDQISARLIAGGILPSCLAPTTATSNAISLTVNPILVPNVTITSSATIVCSGTGVTFTATGLNSGSNPTYTWFRNNTPIGTGTTISVTPSNGDQITFRLTAGGTLPACLAPATAISNAVTLTVSPIPSPNVTITSSATTVCSGTGVTFTATGVNGGSIPTYTWFRNNTAIGTGTTISVTPSNGDQISARLTAGGTLPACLSPTTATSNAISLTVNPILIPNVSISSSATTVCSGTGVAFTATGINGGSNPTYNWFRNNTPIGTGSTISITPSNGDQISARLTDGGTLPACLAPTTATSNAVSLTVNPILIPNVSIASSATTVCSGTGVAFTASGTNLGNSPRYTWFRNNTLIGLGTTISVIPNSGDLIKAILTTSGTCISTNSVTSNVVQLTVNPRVQAIVSISASANPTCSNTGVSYTASPTNGGSNPSYVWTINGIPQSSTGNTLNYTPSQSDRITAQLTAGGTLNNCLINTTATSNTITAQVTGTINTGIGITTPNTTICQGILAIFTSTAIGTGSAPEYAWYVNGNKQTTTTNSFSYTANTGDRVLATMSPGGNGTTCILGGTATSNGITLTVQANQSGTIAIQADRTSICNGENVTLTATATNLGSTPTYTWYVNGQIQSQGAQFSYAASDNDLVSAIAQAGGSLPNCLSNTIVTSNGIGVQVNNFQQVSVAISSNTTQICSGTGVTFTATGVNAGTSPTYTWWVNNLAQTTDNSFTYNPSNSDVVLATISAGGTLPMCLSNTTATSNTINLSVDPCLRPQVNSITGPAFVATGTSNVTYAVPNVSGDSYQWTVPPGAIITNGQGTNSITVDFGTSSTGQITLTQTNANGSTQVQQTVTVGTPPSITSINGPTTMTEGSTGITYSITSVPGTSYQWTVPAGVTITSGQGTSSITVDYGVSVTGVITLTATNSFGTSTANLSVQTSPLTGMENSGVGLEMVVYPNPFQHTTFLKAMSSSSEFLTIELQDLSGNVLKHWTGVSSSIQLEFGEGLPSGVYTLAIKQKSAVKIFKLVKVN